MRLAVTFLGLDLFSVEISTSEATDEWSDLSGGTLVSDSIDPGETDVFLGFTNGREVE